MQNEQIKAGEFPDEEFCGGTYYEAEVNGSIREIGNQGVTNVLNPIGDINNDGFDDLLVTQLRFYTDEQLNFENQDGGSAGANHIDMGSTSQFL